MSDPTRRQLLAGSAAMALTGITAPPARGQTAEVWTNWAGNVRFSPAALASPATVDEVAALVKDHARIKAVGAGYSFNGAPETQGTLMRLDGLAALRAVDGDTVWLEAGLTGKAAGDLLAERDLYIPSLGNCMHQSLAGALSTATHGSGMGRGSLSDGECVLAMELVDGTGKVRTLEIEGDELAAARVGLGALGVITAVKFRVAPMHRMRLRRTLVTEEQGLDRARIDSHDHYQLFWVPFTDRFFTVTRDATDDPLLEERVYRDWWDDWAVEHTGHERLLKRAARKPEQTPKTMARIAGAIAGVEAVGQAHEVVKLPNYTAALDTEYALPIDRAGDALDAIRSLSEAWASDGRFYLNLPVQFRFARGDRGTLLSPSQGRDTVYVDVASHHRFGGWEPFFEAVGKALTKLGGRPHWGKVFTGRPQDAYPDFARWKAVRESFDPDGRFLNPWVEALLA